MDLFRWIWICDGLIVRFPLTAVAPPSPCPLCRPQVTDDLITAALAQVTQARTTAGWRLSNSGWISPDGLTEDEWHASDRPFPEATPRRSPPSPAGLSWGRLPYRCCMAAVDLHHQHLRRCWVQEQGRLEERRQVLLKAAGRAAAAMKERWPLLQGVWLFGSAREPHSLQSHSDLDLVVRGLPADAQLEALGLVEAVVDRALANAGQKGIAIDLARWEDLPPHWQERLQRQAIPLP